MSLEIRVGVDTGAQKDALRAVKRDLRRMAKVSYQGAGEREVLPYARVRAWSFVSGLLTIRASGRGATLTTKGPKMLGRAAGLLEFGGTVRTVIRPRTAEAVSTPFGPRAAVKTPRHYRPSGVLTLAVRSRVDSFEREATERMETQIAEKMT